MKKRSIKIEGHATSISLEDEFWAALQACATEDGVSLQALIEEIDATRQGNLSSAIRLYILERLQIKIETLKDEHA